MSLLSPAQLDATVRNTIAEDLAETIPDALEGLGLKDWLEGIGRGSVSKDSIDDIIVLRNAACELKERLAGLLGVLDAQLGKISEPERNELGVQLPRILEAMERLMIGMLETMELGDVVQLATGSRAGLGALRELLRKFATEAASFFQGDAAAATTDGVVAATASLRSANVAAVANLREVPTRLRTAVRAIDLLVRVLEDDATTSQLRAL